MDYRKGEDFYFIYFWMWGYFGHFGCFQRKCVQVRLFMKLIRWEAEEKIKCYFGFGVKGNVFSNYEVFSFPFLLFMNTSWNDHALKICSTLKYARIVYNL